MGNSFAALDSVRNISSSNENHNRNNRNGRDNYHSKGSIGYDRRNSRSGSQHRSRENSLARNFNQRNIPPFNRSSQSMNALPIAQQPSIPIEKSVDLPSATNMPMLNPVEPTSNEVTKVAKLVRELLENHHIGEVSIANCHTDVDKIRNEYRWVMIRELLNTAVEVQRLKTADRTFAGKSINQWIKMKLINVNDVLTGLKSFLELVEDIALDIPHIWLYIAEIIGKLSCTYFCISILILLLTAPIIENEHLKLSHLKIVCPDHVHRILEDLLPYLELVYGADYVKNLLKLYELTNLIPKPELISTVSTCFFI